MPLLPASKIDIGHLPLLFRGHFEQAVGIQGFPARRFHRLTELAHGGANTSRRPATALRRSAITFFLQFPVPLFDQGDNRR